MRQSITKELLAYWNVLRQGRSAPERIEIDPGVIRSLLADTFILEHDSAGGFPFRLSGTRNNALFDRELRLRPFIELFQSADRAAIKRITEAVSDDMLPMIAGLEAERHRRKIHLELLLLPLRHHGKTHSRLLGCLTPMTTPEWLGLFPIGDLQLKSFRVLNPAVFTLPAAQSDRTPVDTLPILERRAVFTAGPTPEVRTRRHLTIYDGGR